MLAPSPKRDESDRRRGIWVSGFFGSGKSSFAKNLGQVLENRTVHGQRAADLFRKRLDNSVTVSKLIDSIHCKFPVKAIMFDVQSDRALGSEPRSIAHYMYRVLLRELGYAEDFDLADLEMLLEDDGKLADFERRIEDSFGEPWSLRRKKAARTNEANAIQNELDPTHTRLLAHGRRVAAERRWRRRQALLSSAPAV